MDNEQILSSPDSGGHRALADRVRDYRRRAYLSQRALAEASGVSKPTIQRIESGEIHAPRVSTLEKLRNILAAKLGTPASEVDLLPEE
jgi:transcriptional regulator with XRE-family HTH domain